MKAFLILAFLFSNFAFATESFIVTVSPERPVAFGIAVRNEDGSKFNPPWINPFFSLKNDSHSTITISEVSVNVEGERGTLTRGYETSFPRPVRLSPGQTFMTSMIFVQNLPTTSNGWQGSVTFSGWHGGAKGIYSPYDLVVMKNFTIESAN